ncbi:MULTISPECIES: hypothetical protein [unclassified Microcoleus]|uniref:hypothetical protein n=1 Tax=unclassified Microcoleus TaxID=2642155 RepID=UPI001DF6BA2C|nr:MULTISPECIES: hypothetical protein [unclassified Microcoleus]MCC3442628.1 hypothetical protein [Microcoleus sp. PH2017_03_ELD_O_A]MCC3502865.1 hypothetical protein [Microcoleus sp. PH2017_19_SFW_U_A]TAE14767.1 MAG: hypothetical protein EAZ94_06225 [Oscillatoriales cyanobacterium]MCC3410859.1 hypothetical protein [Microcoleus sp. PH2017_02_FOX_O_A]MCC3471032.1 hypothetical protein [Microcoleus sp. PH2017_13_LAR_U_A]
MATESFKVLQKFGLENLYYKILVQAKSGNRYFVWYYDSLDADVSQEVLINFDDDYWRTINNPRNGNKSNIGKVNKVN